MKLNRLLIPLSSDVNLLVYSGREDVYYEEGATSYGESCWQLEEGKQYNYEFVDSSSSLVDNWFLSGSESLLTPNPLHSNRGTISTGIFVGTATFIAKCNGALDSVQVPLEIRSVKTGYQEHYRHMLDDIAHEYADLVMQQGSPVTQRFEVDYDTPQETLYQKFAFVKNIIEAEEFEDAIHKIVSNPVRKWKESTEERHIEAVHRLSRSEMRQVVTRENRFPVKMHSFRLKTLPRYITVRQKIDSIDTPENQFVKYVLSSFYVFCSDLGMKKHAGDRLKTEIKAVCNRLNNHLGSAFFKDISSPSHLNIGSPVLQRKEGYREILQAWLMFDLAAKIAWKGGDNVYSAGKKNVAVLYEYWLFFKLMKCVSEVFTIQPAEKSTLVSADEDNINLSINQGRMQMIHGSTIKRNRLLNVDLYYNRTFVHKDKEKQDKAGSWTMNMRPDYTLTIWPGEMPAEEAERKDAIVYIHFDAKYRLDKILLNDKPVDEETLEKEFQQEKEDREKDIYRRGDLLKMHAYKDAIRRTSGAYVLYPGDNSAESSVLKGYQEIIPGLGAFPISPGHEDEQLPALKHFLEEVVEHFANRTSQREKIAVVAHEIHQHLNEPFYEPFPEPYNDGVFPDSLKVLVGCYESEKHLRWIAETKKYCIPFEGARDKDFYEAKYLLLYDKASLKVNCIMKVAGGSPVITPDSTLTKIGYPLPTSGATHLLYDVSMEDVEQELLDRDWYVEELIKSKSYSPFIVTYNNLFAPCTSL